MEDIKEKLSLSASQVPMLLPPKAVSANTTVTYRLSQIFFCIKQPFPLFCMLPFPIM